MLPGRQAISIWLTSLIGIAAAIVGTLLAAAIGVARAPGIDWIELLIQIALAAVGVALVAGMRHEFHGEWNYTLHPAAAQPPSTAR